MSVNFEGEVKPSSIEQAGFDKNLLASRFTEIPSGQKMRLDYDVRTDGQPVYQGFAPTGLGESQDGWLIYKFTYDGSNNMTQRDIAGVDEDVNWTGRTGYTYD